MSYDPFAVNIPKIDTEVGVFNPNSFGIDYSQYSSQGLCLSGIKISWNTESITGLELAYNGKPVGPVLGKDSKGSFDEVFLVDQGDHIVEILGRFSNVLNAVYIRTKKGKAKSWGNPYHGKEFRFTKDNHIITALKVRASTAIDFIIPVYAVDALPWPISNLGNFTEHVRPSVKGDEEYNDFEWLSDKFNYKIAKVSLWHDNQTLQGIQFHYEMDGTLKSPGQHVAETNDHTKKLVLQNDQDEYLVSALVNHGQSWINYIKLTTNKGKSLEAGNPNAPGAVFLAHAKQNQQIIAVKGELNQSYRKLGFFFDEWYG